MKRLLFLVLALCLPVGANAAVLVFSPNGVFVTKVSLPAAVAAADVAGKGIVNTSPITISSNLTVPSNVTLGVERGGIITVNNCTLTIAGDYKGGMYQCFNLVGTGQVVFTGNIPAIWEPWYRAAGSTDVGPTTNQAIQSAVASGSNCHVVKLTEGTFTSSVPIGIYSISGGAYGYVHCELYGAGWAEIGSTIISPTFSDKPAVFIQSGRSCVVQGIEILGTAYANLHGMTIAQVLSYPLTGVNSWQSLLNGARDSQYSPYVGIVVDPFGSSVPSDGGYPGMSSYYMASTTYDSGSSHTRIKDCYIGGFAVGVLFTGNQTTLNDDTSNVEDCDIRGNKTAIATGQDQTRSIHVTRLKVWGGTRVIFDTVSYGQSIGQPPLVNGIDIAGGVRYYGLMHTDRGMSSNMNVVAESLGSLGQYFGTYPVSFVNSKIRFALGSYNGVAEQNFQILNLYGPTLFEGCYLGYYNNNQYPLNLLTQGNLSIWNTSLDYFLCSNQGAGTYSGGMIDYKNVAYQYPIGSGFKPFKSSMSVGKRAYANGNIADAMENSGFYTGSTLVDGTTLYTMGNHEGSVGLGSIAVTVSGITATFTYPAGTLQVGDQIYSYNLTGVDVAESVITPYWAGVIGKVTNISGTTVTISNIPQALTSGTYSLSLVYQKWFRLPTTGTTANGNNVITSAATPITGATVNGIWPVGARIAGAGIPAGTYVTAATSNSITLSQNATASATGVALYDIPYSTSGVDSANTVVTGTWTPTATGVTLASGSPSGATYSGSYRVEGNKVSYTIKVVPSNTTTIAFTSGSTYFSLPPGFVPVDYATGSYTSNTSMLGSWALAKTDGNLYPHTISATAETFVLTGSYFWY